MSTDKQVGGTHYTDMKLQPWDIIAMNNLDYWEGNVIKYLLRRKADRVEDLKKALHYLEYLLTREELKGKL